MRWFLRLCVPGGIIAGMLSFVACTATVSTDRDNAMMSRPSLYRGAQYHPHPHGLDFRQADLELAPGVAYNGCVSVLAISIRDADAGKGLDCTSGYRISFEPGVRYGDCRVLRSITLAEAESGSGLLCDIDAERMTAAWKQPLPHFALH